MTTRAVDLSRYQGAPDFARLRAGGIAVVIVKLTEGVSGIDPSGLANVAAAKAAGLRVLPYHFVREGDPEAQAAHFVEQLIAAGLTGERPCVDFEDEGASAPTADDLVRFLRALRGALRRRPIVYVNPDKIDRAHLAGCPEIAALSDLWLARWAATPGAVPAPWRAEQLVLWQRGAGHEAGIAGPVDEDVVVGDLDGDLAREGSGSLGTDPAMMAVAGLPAAQLPEPSPGVEPGPRGVQAPAPSEGNGDAQEHAPAAPAAQEGGPTIEAVPCDDTPTGAP